MKSQQGVALITILVMVALATILAASIAQRQAHTSEGTAYLMRQNQSLLYAKSAEAFFSELLKDDAQNAADVDHLHESWALPMPAFPVEDGYVRGQLNDESGKFNLNLLLKSDGTVNEAAKLWFERLLERVDLPVQLSEAVIDWQDQDDLVIGAMGAESHYYQALRQPVLQSNQPFYAVEELKMVRGFEGENYLKIAPYVTASPQIEGLVNINTAPAMLLASIDKQLDVNRIEQLLQQRKANAEYFTDVEELWKVDGFNRVAAEQRSAVASLLGVQSHFFQARIEVMLSERKRQFTTHIYRDAKHVQIRQRSMTPF